MKILAVHQKAFRAGVNLTIPTDAARVLVTGSNGSGKTSVRESLRWALTGRASVTDAKGSGSMLLMPTGETAVEVALELEGLGGISRTLSGTTKAFAVNGFTGDGATQQLALYDRLQTTQAYLDAVLDSGHFLALHHADAKGLILTLLDVRVTDGEAELTLDEVDAKYDTAFTGRKAAKIRVKSFAVPAYPAGDHPPTVEAIQTQIDKIRGKLEGLTSTVGKVAGQRQQIQSALSTLTGARAFQPFKAELSAEEVDRQIGVLDASVSDLEKDLDVAVALPTRPDPNAAQDVTVIRRTIDLLTAHKPKQGCVMDGSVPCETHKNKFNVRVKALQDALQGLQGAETPVGPSQPAQPSESALQAARKRLTALRMLKLKYEASAIQQRDRQAEIDRLTGELNALPADAQGEADIVELKGRIAKGEGLLTTARAYWTALYNHQEGLKEKARLDAEVERLEAEVEKWGPNGLKAAALESAIGAFGAKVNRFTTGFGWTLGFEIDPWGVTANGRAVETYSESEQFLIGIALQLAIAEVSGLSFAVVDRLDMLDHQNRAKATQMLLQCPLEQVFILSTREKEQALPAARAGLIAHRLERKDGRTRIVESVGL